MFQPFQPAPQTELSSLPRTMIYLRRGVDSRSVAPELPNELQLVMQELAEHRQLFRVFDELDRDKDGSITRDEFNATLLKLAGGVAAMPHIDRLFQALDRNHNGTLTFSEFIKKRAGP